MSPTQQFITDHSNDDVQKLALQAARYPEVDMAFALRQIAGRQKVKHKIPSFYQNPLFQYPAQLSLEQSSSEITARYKAQLCSGHSMVDLTGGFGIDMAFMAPQFEKTYYVERQTELCDIAAHNFGILGLSHITVFNRDAVDFLQEMPEVDLIFLDPARRGHGGQKVFRLADCEPDVSALKSTLLAKAPKVMIKLSPMLDISQLQKELTHISEIHILSVDNECKELIAIMERNFEGNTQIITQNFAKDSPQTFSFGNEDESNAMPQFASHCGKYLYEPNASVMKAGAFKLVAAHFDLQKLHPHTHLYTSDECKTNFPGRIFEIVKLSGHSKQELKNLKSEYPKANIAVRNYPDSVEILRKKTGIKDGGDDYIFACKMLDEKYYIISTKKLSQ